MRKIKLPKRHTKKIHVTVSIITTIKSTKLQLGGWVKNVIIILIFSADFKQVTLWLAVFAIKRRCTHTVPFAISAWRQPRHVTSVQLPPITPPQTTISITAAKTQQNKGALTFWHYVTVLKLILFLIPLHILKSVSVTLSSVTNSITATLSLDWISLKPFQSRWGQTAGYWAAGFCDANIPSTDSPFSYYTVQPQKSEALKLWWAWREWKRIWLWVLFEPTERAAEG